MLKRFVFVLLALIPAAALSQQRPLTTEDPRTIPYGAVVTEMGLAYYHRARFPVSGLEGDRYSVLVNGLHVGIGPFAEFQIGGVAHDFVTLPDGERRNDWGDFWLSTKIRLTPEGRWRPIVTFRPTVVLPNASAPRGIGTDGTDFFADLIFGKTLGPAFVFGNLGLGILDDPVRASAQQDVLRYGVAASIPLGERVNAMWEWNGHINPQEHPSAGGENRSQAALGLQIQAAGIRWDAGVTAGLTRWDHQVGWVAGVTKEIQFWQ